MKKIILKLMMWLIPFISFSFKHKEKIKIAAIAIGSGIAVETKAQNYTTYADFTKHVWYIYKTNSPGNTPGNFFAPFRLTTDTINLRSNFIYFDSIRYHSDVIDGSYKMMSISPTGKLSATTFSTMNLPFSQVSSVPNYLLAADTIPLSNRINLKANSSSLASYYLSSNPNNYISSINGPQVTSALTYTPYNSTNPAGYLSSITGSQVTSALTYTPYNSTNPAGYLSSITGSQVTSALTYTPYNSTNPSGYLSSITGSQVTSALTYTPYNSTNPAGYLSSITGSQVTSALTYTPYNSTNPSGYLSSITGSQVTSALTYTPYNSTNPAGYLSSITGSQVTSALTYTPYNSTNPSGYLSSITGSQVTSALTYTPYNSTNPAGYLSSITGSQVTSALGYTPLSNTVSIPATVTITSAGSSTVSGTAPNFTINTATSLPPNGSAGGDLTSTYPNPSLTTTGVTPGTYDWLTVDSKGRATLGGNASSPTALSAGSRTIGTTYSVSVRTHIDLSASVIISIGILGTGTAAIYLETSTNGTTWIFRGNIARNSNNLIGLVSTNGGTYGVDLPANTYYRISTSSTVTGIGNTATFTFDGGSYYTY